MGRSFFLDSNAKSGLGTKLLNLQSHDFAVFFSKLHHTDIILGRKSVVS